MSINQHYKLSDATAVLHFIVGYNNEMEVQKKKRQQSKTEWERQRERERQSKADAATRRITFLLKCEKPFAVVAVYTRCLHSPSVFPSFCPTVRPVLSVCAAHCIAASYPPCVCSMQHVLCCLVPCLCACLSVCLCLSLFIAHPPLLALHFACKKHNNQGRDREKEIKREREKGRARETIKLSA